ncbi:MAG: hypothetical protein MZV65_48245 [Chromatiales bacterium]|nr:hypothetical protein [Chromatiales bacterium]
MTVASSDSAAGELGNVTVAAGVSIDKTAGGDATLSLIALRNVVMEPASAIVSGSGRLNVVLRSDTNGSGSGGIWIQDGSSIVTNGGAVTLGGGVGGFAAAGFLEVTGIEAPTLSLNEPIRVTAGTIDTRSSIDPAVGGDFSAFAVYLANATLPATGTSAVRFSGSTVTTGSGNISVVAASSGAGANANAGITMTPFGEETRFSKPRPDRSRSRRPARACRAGASICSSARSGRRPARWRSPGSMRFRPGVPGYRSTAPSSPPAAAEPSTCADAGPVPACSSPATASAIARRPA